MAYGSAGQVIPDAPKVSYEVTSQQDTIEPGPNNVAERGIRINFKTANGHPGSVFIPYSRYSVVNAQAAIIPLAYALDQVGALTS